ncbi:MAG: amidohydrolase [Ruminococcus sp.]|nr:amidohydrolase [Ruminococcus sp.]
MKYIDFHTHAFVDSLAERAVGRLAETSDIKPFTDGTVRDLKRALADCGIDGGLILPVATKPSQQRTINDWAASCMDGTVFSFGTVHPDAEDIFEELEHIKSLGMKGVKFHPEYQLFHPDEERMMPVYRKTAELGLCAVFHGGWDPLSPDYIRGTPERFARTAEAVPELTFIVAHLGGMNLWDDVEKYLAGKFTNVYFDTAVIAGHISDEQLLRIIRTHGAERILFGSDCPWDNPVNEIEMLNRLPLTEDEREMIFYRNAEKLL